MNIALTDSFGVTDDAKLPFLTRAIDPTKARRQLEACLRPRIGAEGSLHLLALRLVRHKPGRRALVEYDVRVERGGAADETLMLIGKARARGLAGRDFQLQTALWQSNFGPDSADGICVPEPVGIIPDFQMWLQRKAPGVRATSLLAQSGGAALAARIAEAAWKIHRLGVPVARRHAIADELRILHERLGLLMSERPDLTARLKRVLAACDRLGASLPEPTRRTIHRDFYPDQVLVADMRLYLLDFDLYCEGDPALDIGNFLGHVTEQSLRATGDPRALRDVEEAFEKRYVELAGERVRADVRAYATLSLVRHIHLSTQFAERQHLTEAILELCERRLL
ncbi:MAG: phosphotransferase family protein [Pyrinomonadaceae bacterium]